MDLGQDIGAEMVKAGWGLAYRAYSTNYVVAERQARAERVGVWIGEFIPPPGRP